MQRTLRRKIFFWRALLGAVTTLLAGAFVIYCLWGPDANMMQNGGHSPLLVSLHP